MVGTRQGIVLTSYRAAFGSLHEPWPGPPVAVLARLRYLHEPTGQGSMLLKALLGLGKHSIQLIPFGIVTLLSAVEMQLDKHSWACLLACTDSPARPAGDKPTGNRPGREKYVCCLVAVLAQLTVCPGVVISRADGEVTHHTTLTF